MPSLSSGGIFFVHPNQRNSAAPVIVVDADDVVLTEIIAALHLDQVKRLLARIGQPMLRSSWDEGRFIFAQQPGLVPDRHFGRSGYDDPMFRTVAMLLQRQLPARLDDDPLGLEAVAAVHGLIGSPRPVDLRRLVRSRMTPRTERLDHLLSLLRTVHRSDERRVVRDDAQDVVEPNRG